MEKLKMEHILKIMEQFEKTSINTLKYKNDGEEILLTKGKNGSQASISVDERNTGNLKEVVEKNSENTGDSSKNNEAGKVASTASVPESSAEEGKDEFFSVESPIIGTFYRTPAPGKAPYVKKGDKVSKGDVLCIIEAMKVMNKIESEIDGEIMDICIEDGEPVEYGTCLFKVKPE
ncbi:MAG: acetyl-CoA carboxylase biotin carboxyl carrier protein [Bacteroidales bacterium]